MNSGEQTTDEGYIITGCGYFENSYIGLLLLKTDSLGYVGITEPVIPPVQSDWQVVSPVGPTVTLRYEKQPQGFHALMFDASGRKVDEIGSSLTSGEIVWGESFGPGVYFVRVESSHPSTKKIVLIR
ncbi:T9SS type A sorting domain-containing protein [bacterium]|nr:T9SS type A sorting domain-containing protein [bacterium]